MTKYAIDVDEQYKALVDISLGDKNWSGDQPFGGKITSDRIGTVSITDGKVQPGSGILTGDVKIKGVTAEFSAKISDKAISGTIKYRLLFLSRESHFEGVETT